MLPPIFLSASVPNRAPFNNDLDLIAIRESIIALVISSVKKRELVFGGHPAISPLVEHAARSLGSLDSVHIYQSMHFFDKVPDVAKKFKNLHWTKNIENKDLTASRNLSLSEMRTEMISSYKFSAAIVVGGMDGIYEEISLFKKYHPASPIFPIGTTGGVANLLLNDLSKYELSISPELATSLQVDCHYRRLMASLI